MRHSFSFPDYVREIVKSHIIKAINETSPIRYRQEPAYTTALLSKLEGIVYKDEEFYIEFISTIMDDRGANSAENKSGADFSLTAEVSDKEKSIKKAILFQVKMNDSDLRSEKLMEQLRKMVKITRSPKVMVLNPKANKREPYVCSGIKILRNEKFSKESLPNYFTRRVLTTFDGDTRKDFVELVQNSMLPRLHLLVKNKKR